MANDWSFEAAGLIPDDNSVMGADIDVSYEAAGLIPDDEGGPGPGPTPTPAKEAAFYRSFISIHSGIGNY